ncbi:MAG: class I SAM-dependent DNA methyltransferase [Calditrichota bacterium]
MYEKSAYLYDLIYAKLKDYPQEAAAIHKVLQDVQPRARKILDVACGTGEHAKQLATQFSYEVDGLDLNPDFVEIACGKHPAGRFVLANMVDFDMFTTYDVVMCMFGSIGYADSLDSITSALACFARHLNPGGVILVEPWFTPDDWNDPKTTVVTVDDPELKACRMSLSGRERRISTIHFHYLVGTTEGITHFEEHHRLFLATKDEMNLCFNRAGLAAELRHDFNPNNPRGLYVARVA